MQRRGGPEPCGGAFGFKDIRHLNRIAQMDVTVGGELADAIAVELAGHQRKTPEAEDHSGDGQMKKRRQHQKMAGIISETVYKGLNHLMAAPGQINNHEKSRKRWCDFGAVCVLA